MDNDSTVIACLSTHRRNDLLAQTVAELRRVIRRETQALAIELLAEYLVEVDSALAELLGVPSPSEPCLSPPRQALPVLLGVRAWIAARLEQDRAQAAALAADARRRMPPAQLLSTPVRRPAWDGEDTLLKGARR